MWSSYIDRMDKGNLGERIYRMEVEEATGRSKPIYLKLGSLEKLELVE